MESTSLSVFHGISPLMLCTWQSTHFYADNMIYNCSKSGKVLLMASTDIPLVSMLSFFRFRDMTLKREAGHFVDTNFSSPIQVHCRSGIAWHLMLWNTCHFSRKYSCKPNDSNNFFYSTSFRLLMKMSFY